MVQLTELHARSRISINSIRSGHRVTRRADYRDAKCLANKYLSFAASEKPQDFTRRGTKRQKTSRRLYPRRTSVQSTQFSSSMDFPRTMRPRLRKNRKPRDGASLRDYRIGNAFCTVSFHQFAAAHTRDPRAQRAQKSGVTFAIERDYIILHVRDRGVVAPKRTQV